MNTIFKVTDAIRDLLKSNKLINQVTFGDLFEVDLLKKNIFPLAHVGMSAARIGEGVAYVDFSILFLDIVDEQKQDKSDVFYGNDNEHYILNSMFAAATKTIQEMMRGNMHDLGYQVEDDSVNIEFFSERFEDKLAGCGMEFTIVMRNTLDLC